MGPTSWLGHNGSIATLQRPLGDRGLFGQSSAALTLTNIGQSAFVCLWTCRARVLRIQSFWKGAEKDWLFFIFLQKKKQTSCSVKRPQRQLEATVTKDSRSFFTASKMASHRVYLRFLFTGAVCSPISPYKPWPSRNAFHQSDTEKGRALGLRNTHGPNNHQRTKQWINNPFVWFDSLGSLFINIQGNRVHIELHWYSPLIKTKRCFF